MRSIELGWLSRGDKALPLPRFVYSNYYAGGCYYEPQQREVEIEGRFVPLDSGLIVVSTRHGSEFIGSTIAHEWRHHWQFHNGVPFEIPAGGWPEGEEYDYDAELRRYFRGSRTERDALRFEMRRSPCSYHDEWRSILGDIVMQP